MRNGYALCTKLGLEAITEWLRTVDPSQLDLLRGKLHIGLHRDVEVTDAASENRPRVNKTTIYNAESCFLEQLRHQEPRYNPAYDRAMSASIRPGHQGCAFGRSKSIFRYPGSLRQP
jgi:hypothetical protein